MTRRGHTVQSVLWLSVLALLNADAAVGESLPPLRPILPTDSLLIVSPHPDDESLCCGGIIDSARRLGARVAIVWITYGDGFKWDAMVVEERTCDRAPPATRISRCAVVARRAPQQQR